MRNIINGALIAFFFLNILSCSSGNQVKEDIDWKRDSFVKFETWFYKKTCELSDPESLDSECFKKQHGYTGSGSIIARTFDGSYVLTAAHICDHERELDILNQTNRITRAEDEFSEIVLIFKVRDLANFTYKASVVDYDVELDACITFVWGLMNPALPISKRAPVIGKEYYNVAAPAGFFQKDLVPLFEGRYIGSWDGADTYTIPAIGGSSGSPIINSDGELVGIIYARHSRFHHITISTNFSKLKNFILFAVKDDSRKRKTKLDSESDREIIIKFGE
ncbi:MAG TPA: serine protease [Gammaproteobacteria bacterium]|nr:serine protease [Gammaproteobacteria bacterium]